MAFTGRRDTGSAWRPRRAAGTRPGARGCRAPGRRDGQEGRVREVSRPAGGLARDQRCHVVLGVCHSSTDDARRDSERFGVRRRRRLAWGGPGRKAAARARRTQARRRARDQAVSEPDSDRPGRRGHGLRPSHFKLAWLLRVQRSRWWGRDSELGSRIRQALAAVDLF